MSKDAVTGIKEDQLESKGRESLEAALGKKVQESKTETPPEPEKKEPETVQPEVKGEPEKKKTQDADSELSKYDNILKNTFGFEDEEVNDKARKAAKSWSELQSKLTKTSQEATKHKEVVENLNTVLQKYPSLYEQLNQAVKGQYKENPSPAVEEPIGQPQPNETGQLDYDVSEADLIKQGYLKQSDLEGVDELTKQRKILRAEAKYIRQQESKNYMNDIKTQQEQLRTQQELENIQKENELRATQGFDNFVTQYGVNFAELDDSVMKQINKRMLHVLDPDDPRKIAEDAFEISATQVLRSQNLLPTNQQVQTGGKSVSQIEDTGTSFSKATKQQGKKTLEQQLSERARQNFATSNDPKKQFKQKYG